jgi:peptide/nickel transport system substrate-binding protein
MKSLANAMVAAVCLAAAWTAGGVSYALDNVPRDRTLVIETLPAGPGFKNYNNASPFGIGSDIRNHGIYIFEPLFYWSSSSDKIIPIQATGFQYNADFSEVIVKLRNGVTWSDGKPFTADDVVFTFELMRKDGEGPKTLLQSSDVAASLAVAEKVDDLTVRFKLKVPDPRFVNSLLCVTGAQGVYVVPKHVFETVKDPAAFTFFDAEKGWPVGTGAYKIALAQPERIIMDQRDDWWGNKPGVWGAQAGEFYAKQAEPKRLITVPYMDTQMRVQAIASRSIDWAGSVSGALAQSAIESSGGKVTTATGDKPPYGYVTAWPTTLWFNNALDEFKDVRVRRAMSYAIDRDQLNEIIYQGAAERLISPLPAWPGMKPFIDDVREMASQKRIDVFDPAAVTQLMTQAGYAKNVGGFWAKNGNRVKFNIIGSRLLEEMGPILAEQLRRGGFDVTWANRPDYRAAMLAGDFQLGLWGFNGGTFDPYATLTMFSSVYNKPIRESTLQFYRWSNPEIDAMIEKGRSIGINTPELRPLVKRMVEIWMDEMPSIPLLQYYTRPLYSTAYWKNWPNRDNPYAEGASDTWTAPLVVFGLQRAQ